MGGERKAPRPVAAFFPDTPTPTRDRRPRPKSPGGGRSAPRGRALTRSHTRTTAARSPTRTTAARTPAGEPAPSGTRWSLDRNPAALGAPGRSEKTRANRIQKRFGIHHENGYLGTLPAPPPPTHTNTPPEKQRKGTWKTTTKKRGWKPEAAGPGSTRRVGAQFPPPRPRERKSPALAPAHCPFVTGPRPSALASPPAPTPRG